MKTKKIDKYTQFSNRAKELYGLNDSEVETLFSKKKSILRINTLKQEKISILMEMIEEEELVEVEWYKNAYYLGDKKQKFVNNELFIEGYYYIQNAASLIPPVTLDPKPKDEILEVCAAPGGKSLQILEMTNNKAKLVVNDISITRINKLKNLGQQYNAQLEAVYVQPAQYLTKHIKMHFDKIMVDAPCSSEGLLELANKKTLEFWSLSKIKRHSKLQKWILSESIKLLKPGGTLVYSTCTTAPEENEEVIDFILKRNEDLFVEPVNLKLANFACGITEWGTKKYDETVKDAVRIIPTEYMEAFFVCKLKKKH